MASCITSQWSNSTTPQVRLTVTLDTASSDGDTAVLDWVLEYVAHGYAANTTVTKAYTATINGVTVASGNYNIDGKKSTHTIDSGSVNITKTTSAQTISFGLSFSFNLTWSDKYGGKKSATGSISVPAKTKYTISYNANGGSGEPDDQTKWHGTSLTLSSTKPTRTGYSFKGWALSKADADDGDVYYQAGNTCGKNENLTLYAVWEANTYTVKYDANGGTGAPGSQTKTYGKTLTLSTTKPTRTNYNFLGWATSASATKATYASGGNYTNNAAVTLYAVWELAYAKPRITNSSIERCDANGNPIEDGTYARCSFSWSCDYPNPTLTIEWLSDVAECGQESKTISGSSGTIEYLKFGGGTLNPEVTYTIKITVQDSVGYSTLVGTLSGTQFTVDFLAGGKGVALGKPAELEGVFDVAFQTRLLGGLLYPTLESGSDLNELRTPGFYVGENTSSNPYRCGDDDIPLTSGTFLLEVLSAGPNAGSNRQTLQRITRCDKTKPAVYERWFYTNAWGEWYGGWMYPTLTSKFTMYGTSTADNQPKYRKDGRLVEVRGIVAPTENIEPSTTIHTIFTLPEGYRPDSPIYVPCQGSGNCVWLLRITTNGEVGFSRYRNGDTGVTVTAKTDTADGTWLPFFVTYFAK